MVHPRQLQAARILAGWSQADLAAASAVAVSTIQTLEAGTRDTRLSNVMAILDALRRRGVEVAGGSERYIGGAVVVRGSEADWLAHPMASVAPTGAARKTDQD